MGDRRDAGLPACRRLICPADCVRSRRLLGGGSRTPPAKHPEDSPSFSAAAQYLCRVSPTCWMSTVGIAKASFKIALPSEGMHGGVGHEPGVFAPIVGSQRKPGRQRPGRRGPDMRHTVAVRHTAPARPPRGAATAGQ
jgi:hypothetical protein